MSEILEKNKEYADALRDILKLRGEPVAIKLVKEGEEFPEGYNEPEEQMSHCQALFKARAGECLKMLVSDESCQVGASALNMVPTSEKIASGAFHAKIGMHDSEAAAKKMIDERILLDYPVQGEIVCPLGKADFEPDVVALADIPERIFWVVPLSTAEEGGRMHFSTSPFQCTCEDVTTVPMVTGKPNISLGCHGCRRRTPIQPDEMCAGIPYKLIPGFVEHLHKYETGVMTKAKRD